MRLAVIKEAKYHGSFSISEIYPKYRKLGERMAYNNAEYDFIQDAGARTIRRNNHTACAMTVIVDRKKVPSESAARKRLKDVFHYENLPVTEIERLESSSDRTFYFEVIYSPVNEARYAYTDYAREVQQIVDAGHTPKFPKAHEIRFKMDDYDEIEKQLVKAFGHPIDSVSEEEGLGLRRTSWHVWKDDENWMLSMGAYRPNPNKAFIRVMKHPQYVKEAEYVGSQGIPRQLKRAISELGNRGAFKRGIEHPDKMARIPFLNWLEDNDEHIEMLYHQIKRKGVDGDHRDTAWSAWQHFNPSIVDYIGGPASPQMKNQYRNQLTILSHTIIDFLRDA